MTPGTYTIITNTWHFSSFMNPELEILFCFTGRLWGISAMGSIILAGQLSWYLLGLPSCFEPFWLATWARFSYTDLQHRVKCLRRALPGMAAPPGCSPQPLVLGSHKAGVWSQASQEPHSESALLATPKVLLLCSVSAHGCFLYLP